MTAQNLIARLGDGDRAGTHPRGCDGLHITCARDNAANGDARWADFAPRFVQQEDKQLGPGTGTVDGKSSGCSPILLSDGRRPESERRPM